MHQTFTKRKKRKILMTKTITTALMIALSATTGCIAYAHPPRHPPTHNNHTVRHNPPTSNSHAITEVRAWVWINGHYGRSGIWTHGHWELSVISRNLLSSHPRTHIRWVEGRSRPVRPHRRHRRNRR